MKLTAFSEQEIRFVTVLVRILWTILFRSVFRPPVEMGLLMKESVVMTGKIMVVMGSVEMAVNMKERLLAGMVRSRREVARCVIVVLTK